MKIRNSAAFLTLVMIVAFALGIDPAFAHRFNVALVIPQSDGASDQGREIRDGFMLATTEEDSHAGQESDGHLGGLDVYVTVIDAQGDVVSKLGEADIVAALGSENSRSLVKTALDGETTTLLLPGETPFSKSDMPAVAAFSSAYARAYGRKATPQAAQGYNAARRISMAVRAQGGVDDTAALRRNFDETAHGFTW